MVKHRAAGHEDLRIIPVVSGACPVMRTSDNRQGAAFQTRFEGIGQKDIFFTKPIGCPKAKGGVKSDLGLSKICHSDHQFWRADTPGIEVI